MRFFFISSFTRLPAPWEQCHLSVLLISMFPAPRAVTACSRAISLIRMNGWILILVFKKPFTNLFVAIVQCKILPGTQTESSSHSFSFFSLFKPLLLLSKTHANGCSQSCLIWYAWDYFHSQMKSGLSEKLHDLVNMNCILVLGSGLSQKSDAICR